MADLDWGRIVNIAGGVLLLALGAWVATRRPFRTSNVYFALLVGASAAAPALYNLSLVANGVFTVAFQLAVSASFAAGLVGLIGTAWTSPTPVRRSDAGRLTVAILVGLLFATVEFVRDIRYADAHGWHATSTYAEAAPAWVGIVYNLGFDLFYGFIWTLLLLLPLRAKTFADETLRTSSAVMGAGLVLYPAFNGASQFLTNDLWTFGILTCSAAVLVAAAWLWNTRSKSPTRAARNVALWTLLVPTAGLLVGLVPDGYDTMSRFGGFGLLRIISALILGYGILKHQLLGLDVKVRFAIKTSTIAAVFLAVLFIVANIAQNYLGGQYGVVVGGAAAGLLFFAMAPIQRAAERVAQKAIPVTGPAAAVASAGSNGKEEAYRAALRIAFRDRKLTRDEELGLAHLSDELGLTHKRARELWHEVERRKGA